MARKPKSETDAEAFEADIQSEPAELDDSLPPETEPTEPDAEMPSEPEELPVPKRTVLKCLDAFKVPIGGDLVSFHAGEVVSDPGVLQAVIAAQKPHELMEI